MTTSKRSIGDGEPAPDEGRADAAALLSRTYSADAASYKELWAPIIHRYSRSLLDGLPLSDAARVVDVGAGVGTLLPDLRTGAPRAFVLGVDRAEGMISRGPPDIPRAVMDARRLGLEEGSFDAVIMAFMLFHLQDPIVALREAARILRVGGSVGILTWGGGPGYRALDVWNEEMEAAGAGPASDGLAHHELVNAPEKVASLLERSGFGSIRTWTQPFEHRQSRDEFLAHRTGHGSSKRRLDSLSVEARTICIDRARTRLQALATDDFVDRDEVIFAVATRAAGDA